MPDTKNCPFCYGDVDSRATVCPHCRKKIVTTHGEYAGNIILFLCVVTVPIAFFIGGIWLAIVVLLGQIIVGGLMKKA